MSTSKTLSTVSACILLGGCLDLDSFVHNPVHCSTISESTCAGTENLWDQVCTPCEDEYDWARDYPWIEGTLRSGETIRAIDPASVQSSTLETDDGLGSLDLHFVPSHGEVAELAKTTVLYNHGNYAGIEHYLPRVRMLHEIGFNVVVWDYRGYGKSLPPETPSVDEFFADAIQVRAHADSIVPDASRVVIYANSLGGVPAIEMALAQPGCALLLEAAFTSMQRISSSNSTLSLGESFLSAGRFDNVTKISGYAGPLFVMIGDNDNKFPVADQRAMFENAPGSAKKIWVLPGVKHGISNIGIPEAGFSEYAARIQGFLATHAGACVEG